MYDSGRECWWVEAQRTDGLWMRVSRFGWPSDFKRRHDALVAAMDWIRAHAHVVRIRQPHLATGENVSV